MPNFTEIVLVSLPQLTFNYFIFYSIPSKLIPDFTKKISRDYGVLIEENGVALRGTFLIDEDGILRHSSVNDLSVGRNMDEYLRLVDAFDFVRENGEVCPAQWKMKGDVTMKPSHQDEKTQTYWKNHHELK